MTKLRSRQLRYLASDVGTVALALQYAAIDYEKRRLFYTAADYFRCCADAMAAWGRPDIADWARESREYCLRQGDERRDEAAGLAPIDCSIR